MLKTKMGLGSVFYLSFIPFSLVYSVFKSQVSPSQPKLLAPVSLTAIATGFASSVLLPLAAKFLTVFNRKLGFPSSSFFFFSFFLFFWLNGLEIPFFFPFYYMCKVSWMFPTPRLGRYLIRTDFDFLFYFLGCCLGLIFVVGLTFFIAFKNINDIIKGGKVQFYWNKLLKIIYYIYTKNFFCKSGGGHCLPRSKNSSVTRWDNESRRSQEEC